MPHAPLPGGFDHLAQFGKGRLPAQFLPAPVRVGHQPGRIAGAAAARRRTGKRPPGHLPHGFDHLPVGVARAVAQIVGPGLDPVHRLQGQEVGAGDVGHVDVVADARAVGRVVVGAEQDQAVPLPQGRRQGDGNQVGFALARFAAPLGGAAGVEVAQADVLQAVGRADTTPASARTPASTRRRNCRARRGRLPGWARFSGWPYTAAVDEKTSRSDARAGHRFQQIQPAADVDAVEEAGIAKRVVDERLGGQVGHGLDAVRPASAVPTSGSSSMSPSMNLASG